MWWCFGFVRQDVVYGGRFQHYWEVVIDPLASSESESRVSAYVEGLVGVIGHSDRAGPLRDHYRDLLLPGEWKRVEPLAAVTARACRWRIGSIRRGTGRRIRSGATTPACRPMSASRPSRRSPSSRSAPLSRPTLRMGSCPQGCRIRRRHRVAQRDHRPWAFRCRGYRGDHELVGAGDRTIAAESLVRMRPPARAAHPQPHRTRRRRLSVALARCLHRCSCGSAPRTPLLTQLLLC